MAKSSNPCPAQCSAARPSQREVNASLFEAAGISGDWVNSAMQCGYCGEVYSIGPRGEKVRRGRFVGNTLMTAENWSPLNA